MGALPIRHQPEYPQTQDWSLRTAEAQGAFLEGAPSPLPSALLPAELDFFLPYQWCLNCFPTVGEVLTRLRSELVHLDEKLAPWQQSEVMNNIFLLGCQVSDAFSDFRLGRRYDFSRVAAIFPSSARPLRAMKSFLETPSRLQTVRLRTLCTWGEAWEAAMVGFLKHLIVGVPNSAGLMESRIRLAQLIEKRFPAGFEIQLPPIPSSFRNRDLTPFDCVELGRKLVATFPERRQPILVIGIRSAGSFLAALLRAYLESEGYADLDGMTLRPKRAIGPWENSKLERCAHRNALAVVVDESPATCSTLSKTADLLSRAGVTEWNVVLLLPIHRAGRDWKDRPNYIPLSRIRTLTLEPEEWHKARFLESRRIEARLAEYFQARGYSSASVVESPRAAQLNAELRSPGKEQWTPRLKQVYEVRVSRPGGRLETRYVLAKSVGWGFLGYHAFIAAKRLAQFVPPVLGLRDGILYTEWVSQPAAREEENREHTLRTVASYVSARALNLRLPAGLSSILCRENRDNGFDRLASGLSRAYGTKAAAFLKRPRLRHRLSQLASAHPTLLDARMQPGEWIAGPSSLLKSDFEHHGLGKHQHNVLDPAYDLADAILHFELSPNEERALLDRYVAESGDAGVRDRLLPAKMLAANWAMTVARDYLDDPQLAPQHAEFNRRYLDARTFLVVHTARFCGSLCRRPSRLTWHGPLVVLDLDGVLDRNVFGYPSTTAAGIQAVSILHAHGFAMALNTARTLLEVQEYCQAFGFAGGAAEYGSVLWDAVSGRVRALVTPESLRQMEAVANSLRQIPGIFLNDRYQYSIRAITHRDDKTAPVPTILIQNLLETLGADRLRLIQNETDTTILAREVDKGRGLEALLEWIGQPDLGTIAIGDSQPDLAMFRVAKRSFAPAQINCRSIARSLGCKIARRSYQPGLLEIVRSLAHPHGRACPICGSVDGAPHKRADLILELLQMADREPLGLLFGALLDPMAMRNFEV